MPQDVSDPANAGLMPVLNGETCQSPVCGNGVRVARCGGQARRQGHRGTDWHFILHAPVVIIIIMIVLALLVVILLSVELLGLGFNIFMRTLATIACIASHTTCVAAIFIFSGAAVHRT